MQLSSARTRALSYTRVRSTVFALTITLLLSSTARASLDPNKPITQFVHQSWQSEQGLPQNSVLAVAQTRDGYLWIGTEGGLVRFDGLQLKVFERKTIPGLDSDFITALLVDHLGTLWIGTHGGGLVSLRNGTFEPFPLQTDLGRNAILSLYDDGSGSLWIGTDGGGLVRLHANRLQRLTKREGLPDESVQSISGDRQGTIWVGTHGGLTELSAGKLVTYTEKDGLSGNDVRSILVDRRGLVWIGTHGNGLLRLDPHSLKRFTKMDGLAGNSVASLYEDAAGTVWIGTLDAGLNRFSGNRMSSFTKKDGLSSSGVWTILEDRAGNLWLGGTGGGLTSIREGSFTSITAQEGLVSDTTLAVFQDKAGVLWIGSDAGLTRWEKGQTTRYTTSHGLPDNLVFSVTQDGEGNIWVGTRNGLARLENGRFVSFRDGTGFGSSRAFTCIYTDRHGRLWVASRGELSRFDGKQFNPVTPHGSLPNKLITSLYEDAKDEIWIGTDGGGLLRWKDGLLRTVTDRQHPSNTHIYSILGDTDGTLWLGTNGEGLVHYADGQFFSYTRQDGLIDDAILHVLDDGLGRLWISSNQGIASIAKTDLEDFAANKLRSLPAVKYDVSDGLKSRECNGGFQPAGWRTQDGRLWFPTMKGVAVVDPANLKSSKLPFPVVLEQLLADSQALPINRKLLVPAGKRRLEFRFTAPGSAIPDKLQLSYMLEGFDKDWVQAGSRGIANYTNIAPGSYRFHILACINGQCESNGPGAAIEILPTFYETKAFLLLLAGLLAGSAYGLHRVHVKNLKNKGRALQRLVDERTKELRESRDQLEIRVEERTRDLSLANQNLGLEIQVRTEAERKAEAASRAKSEFLTNMSHEIRTPINGIMGMTEIMMFTELDTDQAEYVDIVRTSADSLLHIVNDILDFSKIEAKRLELENISFELSACVDQSMRLAAVLAEEKGLKLQTILASNVPDTVIGDPGRLRQVLLNLLNNAVKFTTKGFISLQVTLESSGGTNWVLHFAVADTGMGISKGKQQIIFEAFSQADYSSTRQFGGIGLGLAISSQLVQLMDGKMWVESEPDVGSTFHFTATFSSVPAEIDGQNQLEMALTK